MDGPTDGPTDGRTDGRVRTDGHARFFHENWSRKTNAIVKQGRKIRKMVSRSFLHQILKIGGVARL